MANYNNKDESPIKKGLMKDIIKPKQPRYHRINIQNERDATVELHADLVQVLAAVGIQIQNTYTISSMLVKKGWIKTKKIES